MKGGKVEVFVSVAFGPSWRPACVTSSVLGALDASGEAEGAGANGFDVRVRICEKAL